MKNKLVNLNVSLFFFRNKETSVSTSNKNLNDKFILRDFKNLPLPPDSGCYVDEEETNLKQAQNQTVYKRPT